ncbi:ferritin-like domain-containing protein [Luteolibacter flavescens]|uniref:Ferritin-like domain-containing protein n=1 Tax=Luteolibacter flavescens TaxID=1859460 RepID=A0ABT3FU63_9BACT|nr:ferritin-like domain-containing protein [Luteolibacter flavescens]MCW1887118.1 ferritin-like domain-containing protein [Luteolibacter flavescens]
MTVREAAERVLFARTLEEKLALAPRDADDASPGAAILTPDAPGRPPELRIHAKGVRAEFPGIHRLDDDRERGVMLHFLANHELLAAELMALVLLKFPDAPTEYRAGVYEAMREEQMHALMYVRRMKECGIAFGELPVNDYFWRIVAPMETPMDFVTRLNLTFEQANLDFSKHYAGLFRQAGDTATAAVLEKIYQDEIGHVGHGVKWFRRWKERGSTDWEAYRKSLVFPLTAARAKGVAPFNAEGRVLAGLDEDFIRHLEVCEQSRGRTPVVHWFNPNAEGHAMSGRYQPDKAAAALEEDLEMLIAGWCRKDDVAVLRRPPSREHLATLKNAGLELPEITTVQELRGRKLGGLRPWAWSPDASAILRDLAEDVSPNVPWQWREPVPREWLSKEIGIRLEEVLGLSETGGIFRDADEAWSAIDARLDECQILAKAFFSRAGQGHRRINRESPPEATRNWLRNTIAAHGGVVIEPWLERVTDFSALYEMDASGGVELIGLTVIENDAAGRYTGTRVGPKWANLLPPEVAAFLHREAEVMRWYQEEISAALPRVVPGHIGPLGVDAMVHRLLDGSLALKHVVELNVRMTMGRVALELLKKSASNRRGKLSILRKHREELPISSGSLAEGAIILNDPAQAREFVAVWQVEK